MKLYTEEQVRKAWNTAFTEAIRIDEEDYNPTFYGEFMNDLKPIELPSDEEMNEKLHPFDDEYVAGYYAAINMIEEKIKQQDNENI